MKRETFRTIFLTIGFFGMIFMIASKASGAATVVGVLICIILIAFAYIVTGKWGKYLIGEPADSGAMG